MFVLRLFGDPHDYNLDEVVKELVYFKGFSFYTLQTCGADTPKNDNCFLKNFSYFSDKVSVKTDKYKNKPRYNRNNNYLIFYNWWISYDMTFNTTINTGCFKIGRVQSEREVNNVAFCLVVEWRFYISINGLILHFFLSFL